MNPNRYSDAEKAEARELLLNGHTVSQASRICGMKIGALSGIARKMRAEGIPVMRAPQGLRPLKK